MEDERTTRESFIKRQRDNFFVKPSSKRVDKKEKPQATSAENEGRPQKKPFDKKKWRTQKYSIKNKLDDWKDRRKMYIVHEYRKQQKREKGNTKVCLEEEIKIHDVDGQDKFPINKKQNKANRDELRKQIDEEKKMSILRIKAEKAEALKKYKKKKIEQYRKLNKKTKKGQPVMKGRIEYLLEKIQSNMNA